MQLMQKITTDYANRGKLMFHLKPSPGSALLLLFITLITIALAAPGTHASQATAANPARYTFAVTPFYTPEKIWVLYSPFIDYLSKSTGAPWELKLYHNHNELIDALCNGTVSAALLGPVPLGRANSKCGAKPLVAALSNDETPRYHSVVLTNKPSISSLKHLKGMKFGFFKGSTAAHIVPAKMLKDAGVSMSEIQPVFLESQDRIMAALLSGEIAAAGVKETLAKRFSKERLKVVAVSAPLPNFAICATSSLPSSIQRQMISALTRLKPLSSSKDADLVKTWDEEIHNGFMLPGKDFLPSVIKVFELFKEIQNEH
jgi:phosphate/phosphite/phosphonate ABC transporter binding protein